MSLHLDTLFWIRPNQSLLFLLNAKHRSNKYQFYSPWFDPTGAWTHDLPHSKASTLTIAPQMKSVLIFWHLSRCYTPSNTSAVLDLPRLDRLKPRASKFRGPPTKMCIIFNTVIGRSHLCCHNVLYFLNNPSVIFLTQFHSISEYCRILNTPRHPCLYWNWLNTLPSSSSCEDWELGGASQVW